MTGPTEKPRILIHLPGREPQPLPPRCVTVLQGTMPNGLKLFSLDAKFMAARPGAKIEFPRGWAPVLMTISAADVAHLQNAIADAVSKPEAPGE